MLLLNAAISINEVEHIKIHNNLNTAISINEVEHNIIHKLRKASGFNNIPMEAL